MFPMYEIVSKRTLNSVTTMMEINAPFVARKAQPGQFIILRVSEVGERVPLTIGGYDREKGTVTIIFQSPGATTKLLAEMNVGDCLHDFVGPLGTPTEFEGMHKVAVVGGGLGTAIAYPQAKALHEHGAEVDLIVGFRNKDIVVIGGGNVAMDVCRSAVRLGARKVSCVYRRRQEDMTALPEEVEGAVAEGVELVTLQAPVRIETDANGHAVALWTQPQIIGEMDKKGRPAPEKAKRSEKRIAADVVVVAIGQGVETHGFEQTKIAIKRGAFVAEASGQIDNMDGVFAGGDCVTGPATVIRAIAAGKVAAAHIDEYLGFHHEIDPGVEIPTARLNNKPPHGRIDTTEREAGERKHDFKCIECGLTDEEAYSEASRCLRCDHFGYGIFRGGRKGKW